jgi:hypothetical protein
MTSCRDMLSNIKTKACQGEPVAIADNTTYKEQNRGNMRIKMPYGQLKNIKNVWRVPELTKN